MKGKQATAKRLKGKRATAKRVKGKQDKDGAKEEWRAGLYQE